MYLAHKVSDSLSDNDDINVKLKTFDWHTTHFRNNRPTLIRKMLLLYRYVLLKPFCLNFNDIAPRKSHNAGL